MLFIFVIINIIGFLVCMFDKLCAIKHKWRVKESTILMLAFLGGAAGVLLAMLIFRHKIRSIKFCVSVPIMLVLQIAAIIIF